MNVRMIHYSAVRYKYSTELFEHPNFKIISRKNLVKIIYRNLHETKYTHTHVQ